MHSIGITLFLTAVLTALSSAEHDEQLTIDDLFFPSNAPPSVQLSDELAPLPHRGDGAPEQNLQALRERDPTFGWYSREYTQNHLYQWIFGNATNIFNISISTCINSSTIAGVYQFMNGSTIANATAGDIYKDLGYGTALGNRDEMVAQTLINAQAAYNDISNFLLDFILCSASSPLRDDLRRQLLFRSDGFQSNGRVMTLILQGAGGMIAYFTWNGIGLLFDHPGLKMLFGGIATLNLILVLGILEILRQEGVIAPYEAAFVGSVFLAKARDLILRATQIGRAGQAAGPCLTGTQLAAAAAQAGSGSAPAPDLDVVGSADLPAMQALCERGHFY